MATCPPQLTSDTESATKDSQAGQPIKRSARVSMRAPEISHDQPPTRMMNRRNEAPGGTRRRSTISPMPPPSAPPVSASYVLTIPGCSPCDAGTEANSVSLASGVTTLMRLFGIPSAPSATPCSASARDLDSPKTASMSSHFQRAVNGVSNQLRIVGIHDERIVQLAAGARKTAQDEHAALIITGRDIFFGHEIHAVMQ